MAWALVTGASSGIGWEFAKVLAENGFDIFALARREDRLQNLKSEIESQLPQTVVPIPVDLTNPDELNRAFQIAHSHSCDLEVVVNNAGFGSYGPFSESDLSKNLQMIDLNVRALTHLTQLATNAMLTRGKPGYICNVASTAAFQPGPHMAVYFASKAYVLSFSEALFAELAEKNISVTALCPGPTQSEFGDVANFHSRGQLNKLKLPTSRDVALHGYKALMQKKPFTVPGVLNKLLASSPRLVPRGLVTRIAKSMIRNA